MPLLTVSQSAMCNVLWFRTLTYFTHTLISCARAEGAGGRLVPEEKNPSHFIA